MTAEIMSDALSLPLELATERLEQLEDAGYVDLEFSFEDGTKVYRRATQGNRLAKVKFIRPISREKAEQLVESVLERATQINESDEFIHYVEEISVFGSFLTDATELGDIDLIVEDRFKEELGDQFEVTERHAALSGRRFGSWLDVQLYPRQQVEMALRNRSPYIDIQTPDQIKRLGLKPKLLFERDR